MAAPNPSSPLPPLPRPHDGLPHPLGDLPHPPHDIPHPNDNLPRRDNSMFQNYSMNGKIIMSALGVLFFIVFIIVVLHMYTRWCWRNSNTRRRGAVLSRLRSSLSFNSHEETSKGGSALDSKIMETLPIFTYTSQLFKGAANFLGATTKSPECAVCLTEFQQEESCKLLPKCKHFFHVGCIDMWFQSNSTCPLCRAMPAFVDEEAGSIIEQGQEAQREQQSIHSARDNIVHGDEEHGTEDKDSLLLAGTSLQPQQWRRSFSDKFPYIVKEAGQSPASHVLCWNNHPHVTNLQLNAAVGGRSFSRISRDILRPTESLGEASISSLVSPRQIALHPHAHCALVKGPRSVEKLVSK